MENQAESEWLHMDTKEMTAEYRLAHWAQIMRDRKGSGLSIRQPYKPYNGQNHAGRDGVAV